MLQRLTADGVHAGCRPCTGPRPRQHLLSQGWPGGSPGVHRPQSMIAAARSCGHVSWVPDVRAALHSGGMTVMGAIIAGPRRARLLFHASVQLRPGSDRDGQW